jgi:antitoxin ParD1/3/4
MSIKLSKRTEEEVTESLRHGAFESADELIREGISLVKARQAFRQAVHEGAAYADRGELLDGEQVFDEVEAELREAGRRPGR